MKTVLQINTSLYAEEGQSSRLASALIQGWQLRHPEDRIVLRDLASDPVPGIYAHLAQRLDVSPLFLSLALKRLRQRFRELVDDEITQTVASAVALEEERRSLHAALQSAA